MKKRKFLIITIGLFLVSCNSATKKDDNENKGLEYEDYFKIPTEDYYQEYESATLSYYESTDDVHVFNKKELKLNDELFNEWKTFTFEYINYGNRKNLKEYGEGASISDRYFIVFKFGNESDVLRFKKDDVILTGLLTGTLCYYNNENPKVSDELIQKKNDLVTKIDKELEKIESEKIEHYC